MRTTTAALSLMLLGSACANAPTTRSPFGATFPAFTSGFTQGLIRVGLMPDACNHDGTLALLTKATAAGCIDARTEYEGYASKTTEQSSMESLSDEVPNLAEAHQDGVGLITLAHADEREPSAMTESSPVPEPSTFALLCTGVACFSGAASRARWKSRSLPM